MGRTALTLSRCQTDSPPIRQPDRRRPAPTQPFLLLVPGQIVVYDLGQAHPHHLAQQ